MAPAGCSGWRAGSRRSAPLLAAGCARADGAFPDSLGLMTPEQLPDETLLATNFGLVMSFDRDQTWIWACEQGANNFATLYQMGPPPRNRIYAMSPTASVFTDDTSCSWTRRAGTGRRRHRRLRRSDRR